MAGSTEKPVTITDFALENAKISGDAGMAIVVSQINGNPQYTEVGGSAENKPNLISNVHVVSSEGSFSGDNCGIFIGRGVNNTDAVRMESCSITNSTLNCIANTSTNVKNWGMLIGNDHGNGLTRINNCTIENSHMTSTKCNFTNAGMAVGLITGGTKIQGSTIQNCSVSRITNTINTKCKKIGGLVGYISNVGTKEPTTIKSCYVENCDFRASQEASGMIGASNASSTVFEDLYYYNCVLIGTTDSKVAGTEIISLTELKDGTVATRLNNTSEGTVINWIKLKDRETGEDFVFADVHLEEPKTTAQKNPWGYTIDSASGTECRNKQAKLIVDQLEKAANGAAIIQAGDYNAGPGKDAYNTTLENGYQCVRNFSQVADTHGGYNAWTRVIEKFAKGDHVFTSPLCTSDMYDVRAEDDIDEETGYHISDHCAIYTTIQY